MKKLSVCFFGYDEKDEGGRVWALKTGCAENGVTVQTCQTLVRGPFAKYLDLYRKWESLEDRCDALYVVFMGYYLMPLAWYLARRRGIPLILDTLVSQYDTEVVDRRRVSRWSPRAWFLWALDWSSCALADAIVVDTRAHGKFFTEKFYVDTKKIIIVPVGCRSDLFVPLPSEKSDGSSFIVEFHGGISRLQGVKYILEAAEILQDKDEAIHFEITGRGQLSAEISLLAQKLKLRNVVFLEQKPLQELPHTIARGDVCLGIFGTTEKALRVVPNKVYECMSCGKPVITERSPAALEVLRDREDVYMVRPGDGTDLAEKILMLRDNAALRSRLGERARELSLNNFSPRAIVIPLVEWIKSHL